MKNLHPTIRCLTLHGLNFRDIFIRNWEHRTLTKFILDEDGLIRSQDHSYSFLFSSINTRNRVTIHSIGNRILYFNIEKDRLEGISKAKLSVTTHQKYINDITNSLTFLGVLPNCNSCVYSSIYTLTNECKYKFELNDTQRKKKLGLSND